MDVREKLSSKKRLIDANALGIGRCSKDILPPDYCNGWNGVINLIEKAPTIDAVPVVRCRDCIHYFSGACLKIYSDGNVSQDAWQERNEDDFCSYGERGEREEGDE